MKTCPYCAEEIQDAAIVCKHCGRDLATGAPGPAVVVQAPQKLWSPALAALFSLIIPGAGQMYKGQIGLGLVCLIVVAMSYAAFVFLGLILHVAVIIGAAMGNPYRSASATTTTSSSPAAAPIGPAPTSGYYGCPACQKTVRAGDATCKHCGQALR